MVAQKNKKERDIDSILKTEKDILESENDKYFIRKLEKTKVINILEPEISTKFIMTS
jgi:hypothetical protein